VEGQPGQLQPRAVADPVEDADLLLEHEVEEFTVAELRLLRPCDERIRLLGQPT
jgi:hypothetical protein